MHRWSRSFLKQTALSPVPYRGKRNCSLNLPLVAEEIGRIKGVSSEEVVRVTGDNARRLLLRK